MKIQAINTNTNFKGLFTDKSAQNNGGSVELPEQAVQHTGGSDLYYCR